MSDIKYIIAGEDGENTRFPCLAMVRYAMAAAVSLLAVGVIVLVIHAVFRSEDVHLSVNNGYIGADRLWDRTPVLSPHEQLGNIGATNNIKASAVVVHSKAPADVSETQLKHESTIDDDVGSSSIEPLPKECFLGCNSGDGETTTQYTLKKPSTSNLRVILIASNPSGRTKIDCGDTTVSLIDMSSPYKPIGEPLKLENFTVPPQTTITMQKRLKITDTTYIWDNYAGELRFSVRLQVSSTVTSYPLGKTHIKQQKYTCQPVTVGLVDVEDIFATDRVDCRAS
ncbi:hypothetical protein HU200_059477 [Digitaria exilis]|uniref:Uncharacterized protein n=1 Tax=Digitaria exilis TaxID=1010633 RepID=A0A835AHX9_9POAL|nr:hypothetical protein HU200_059477 [Digitaria exilis]